MRPRCWRLLPWASWLLHSFFVLLAFLPSFFFCAGIITRKKRCTWFRVLGIVRCCNYYIIGSTVQNALVVGLSFVCSTRNCQWIRLGHRTRSHSLEWLDSLGHVRVQRTSGLCLRLCFGAGHGWVGGDSHGWVGGDSLRFALSWSGLDLRLNRSTLFGFWSVLVWALDTDVIAHVEVQAVFAEVFVPGEKVLEGHAFLICEKEAAAFCIARLWFWTLIFFKSTT